ncbi:hypothetical protein ACJMK2_006155 [Sinanodonta woodiana]|uniref:Solute carrier family 23 member 2 n=1 Tax=Sinanodonta woodiana TaxID=1069815 RepID=A0ABD3VTM0_SINWO
MERTSLYPKLKDDQIHEDQKGESLALDLIPEDSSVDHMNEDIKDIIEADIRDSVLLYNVGESPPLGMTLSIGLQHTLMSLGSSLSAAYIISDVVCAGPDHPIRAKLFCTTLFMAGICTLLQTLFGIRLPIFQGPSSSFFVPLISMKKTEGWQCPSHTYLNAIKNSTTNYTNINGTNVDDIMYDKLRQMMGSLILASLLEVLLGCTGLIGLLMRYIGPLTVAPVISLIGLSLFKIPLTYAQKHWGIAGLSASLVTIFILYLNKVHVPLPVRCLNRRPTFTKIPVFQLFPVLFGMAISWIVCAILTITNVLPDDPSSPQYLARTDARLNIIKETPWFYVPYPGQFGSPLFNTSIFVGFLASVISSVLESVGDYHAVALATNSPPPPRHAVNRGILLEGLGSVLSGFMGAGHATTSYTNNIAIVGLTKVASRSCLAAAGLFAILLSLVGRVGAVLSTIPDPVIGGTMLITFGILTAIGLFMLKSLDLSSSRNMAIFGISLYIGLAIPDWMKANPKAASTGIS